MTWQRHRTKRRTINPERTKIRTERSDVDDNNDHRNLKHFRVVHKQKKNHTKSLGRVSASIVAGRNDRRGESLLGEEGG